MEVEQNLYQVTGLSKRVKIESKPLSQGRYLVGSVDNCDVVISHSSIKPIHAVLEIFDNKIQIFSLDADSDILVNGESKTVSEILVGDTVKLGHVVVDFDLFHGKGIPTIPSQKIKGEDFIASKSHSVEKDENVEAPYLIYPFDKNYNFAGSEYIFEDSDQIYPIFKYNHSKAAVEVIIIHKNRIFSVDYIGSRDGIYKLIGMKLKEKSSIEYPYLQKKESVDFIEAKGNSFFVNKLSGYNARIFSNDKSKIDSLSINIAPNDIISFVKADLSIVVRNVEAPPEVKAAPLIPRDKTLLFMCLLGLMITLIPLLFLYNMNIDKEQLKKEKAPERIAKLLFKKKTFAKIKPKPTTTKAKPTTTKPKPTTTKPKPKPKKKPAKKPTLAKKAPGPKLPTKKLKPKLLKKGKLPKKTKNIKNPAPPNKKVGKATSRPKKNAAQSNRPGSKKVGKNTTKNTKTVSPTPNSKGTVDVFKNDKFKSSLNKLLAKGGQFKGIKTQGSSGGGAGSPGYSGTVGVTGGGGVTTANVSGKLGSPTGVKNGVEGFASGADGLTNGTKTFYQAGIPSDTAVLGSMDPDLIRKILRDHIPQFRYCYQKELDKTSKRFNGVVKMVFTIGASGSVSKAAVQSSKVPGSVKSCVRNVLMGIQFPKPLGGGKVEVGQPINFYPKG